MIPKTLDEAIELTKKEMDSKFVLDHTENAIIARYHHTLGQWMRNTWGFWQDSPLKQELVKLGLDHPDDMSGLILECSIRDMKGIDRDVAGSIKHYQEYWINAEKHGVGVAFEIFNKKGQGDESNGS